MRSGLAVHAASEAHDPRPLGARPQRDRRSYHQPRLGPGAARQHLARNARLGRYGGDVCVDRERLPQRYRQPADTSAAARYGGADRRGLAEGEFDLRPLRRPLARLRRRPGSDAGTGGTGRRESPGPQHAGSTYPNASATFSPSAVGAQPAPAGSTPPSLQSNVKEKIDSLVNDLIALQIRVSELDDEHSGTYRSPLLGKDRGPLTDINLLALPQSHTYLFAGVNDTGGPNTTWNFAAMERVAPHLQLGGGLLYSRLGARAVYDPGLNGLGFLGLIYDPRHPTADGYLNLHLGGGLQLFGGERDILHSGRRTAFGLQYQY